MNIIWSEDDQAYITIPDGSIATHQQIKEHFEPKACEITRLYADGKIYATFENHIPRLD